MYDSLQSRIDTDNTKSVGWAKTRIVPRTSSRQPKLQPWAKVIVKLSQEKARQDVVQVEQQQGKAVWKVTIRRASGSNGAMHSFVTNTRYFHRHEWPCRESLCRGSAPEFSHHSWSKRVCSWESSHEATIRIICWTKLRMVIIGRIINMMSALKWAVQCWPPIAFLLTWRQLRSCLSLGTPASCSTCMLPHWHLQH